MNTTPEQLRAIIADLEHAAENGINPHLFPKHVALMKQAAALLRRIGPADGEATYMVMGYGEGNTPDFAFANDRDGVRRAIAQMVWSDPDDAEPEELDGYMAIFDDPDDWSWEGTRMTIKFEIGGIEVTRIAR